MAEKVTKVKKDNYYYGLGRRKSAVATVRLFTKKGETTINGKPAEEYLNNQTLIRTIEAPLVLTGNNNTSHAIIRVSGGGTKGQAEAISLGFARALVEMSEDLRPSLRK